MNPSKSGVGVVYGKDGAPKIDPDFVAHLNDTQRAFVLQDLQAHGYTLNGNAVEKL